MLMAPEKSSSASLPASAILREHNVPGITLDWCWRGVLVTLPITTLTVLGPPSAIRPVAGLIALVALPLVLMTDWRRLAADPPLRWLLAFMVWAILTGGVIVALDPPPDLPGKASAVGLYAKAVMSVVMGLSIYLLARNRLRTFVEVETALRWILIGAIASAMLGYLQVLSVEVVPWLRDPIAAVSSWFGDYGGSTAYGGRAHGLSGEPSYLASALCLSVVPFALATALRPGARSVGLAAVAMASAGLGCGASGSRFGILGMALVGVTGLIYLTMVGRIRRVLLLAAVGVIAGLIGIAPLYRSAYVFAPLEVATVSTSDRWAAAFFDPACDNDDSSPVPRPLHTMEARIAAARASIRTFQDHPVVGCGLGLSPLLLPDRFPKWSLGEKEVRLWLDPAKPELATPMSMHVRIAAETGLIGLVLAIAVLIAHRPKCRHPVMVMLAVTGMVAILLDGFTLASFALPGIWILLAATQVEPPSDHA